MAVGWALKGVGGTGTAAIITMLAVGLRGAAELLALDGPIDAGTALGAPTGDPGLACQDEVTLGIFAAALSSGNTLVTAQYIARLTDTALLASGGGSGAGVLAEAIWVQARRQTGGKAAGIATVSWALYNDFSTTAAVVLDVLALSS